MTFRLVCIHKGNIYLEDKFTAIKVLLFIEIKKKFSFQDDLWDFKLIGVFDTAYITIKFTEFY